jgi:hypothetical protein
MTYAAYQLQEDGTWFRLGTFRGPRGSVRNVTLAFSQHHPACDLSRIEFAARTRQFNGYVDGPRVQAEPVQ